MQITTGKITMPERAVIYGPEFVGKSTLASQFPKPLFIDTEYSTTMLDVARTPKPTSWGMLLSLISELMGNSMGYQTLVIDTADWAEKLATQEVLAELGITGLGGQNDFGHSFNVLEEKWGKFLDSLTELGQKQGMHILLTAHAQIKKLEQPEEFGAYDRYMLKLEKKTSAKTREWSTTLFFANFKVIVVEDGKTKSKKAQGGQRTLYTQHHPCWDGKNRHGLPAELPMDFSSIAHVFPVLAQAAPAQAPAAAPVQAAPQTQAPAPAPSSTPETAPAQAAPPAQPVQTAVSAAQKKLADAMAASEVSTKQLQQCIENHPKLGSIFPQGTMPENYPDDFVEKALLPAWDRVAAKAKEYTNV